MIERKLIKGMVFLLFGAAILAACVDNNYDLNNLDLTAQTGKDGRLTLPSSSTGDIQLGNIFSLNDGSAVEEIDDEYFLNTEGNTDPTNIKINVITIPKPKDLSFGASLDWTQSGNNKQIKGRSRRAPEVPIDTIFKYKIDDLAKSKIENAETTSPISADVVSIKGIGFTATTIRVEVKIQGNNVDIFKNLHFKDLVLHLPVGLHVTSCRFEDKEVLNTTAAKMRAHDEGIIDITTLLNGNTQYAPNSTEPLSIDLTFDYADVTTTTATDPKHKGAYFNPEAHSAKLVGDIQLAGFAYGVLADIDQNAVITKATSYISGGGLDITAADIAGKNWEKLVKTLVPRLDFKGSGNFTSAIAVSRFTGEVQHDINDIKPIELNDLPDFLTYDENTPDDERAKLDLYNPQVFLKLSVHSKNDNVFDQTMKTGVRLEAYLNGKTAPIATANTGELTFQAPANQKDFVLLKRVYSNPDVTKDNTRLPKEYDNPTDKAAMEDIYVPDLGKLLLNVPNRVEVYGYASDPIHVKVSCTDFHLPQDIDINFEYKVFTPLSFGENFRIVYSGTENELADDLDDIKDLDFGGLEVTARISTDLPLPLTFSVIPLDTNGADINSESQKLIVSNITIPAKADNYPILINLKPAEGYTIRDFIRGQNAQGQKVPQFDGIKYKAVLAGSQQGETLRTSQKLVLKDILVSLVGGVTYYDEKKKK